MLDQSTWLSFPACGSQSEHGPVAVSRTSYRQRNTWVLSALCYLLRSCQSPVKSGTV